MQSNQASDLTVPRSDHSAIYSTEASGAPRNHGRSQSLEVSDTGFRAHTAAVPTVSLKKIFIKLHVHVLFDSATTLLRIYPRELQIDIHRNT